MDKLQAMETFVAVVESGSFVARRAGYCTDEIRSADQIKTIHHRMTENDIRHVANRFIEPVTSPAQLPNMLFGDDNRIRWRRQ